MENLSSTLKRTIWIEKKEPKSDIKAEEKAEEESEEEEDNNAEEEKEEKDETKDSAGTISLPTTTISTSEDEEDLEVIKIRSEYEEKDPEMKPADVKTKIENWRNPKST